MSPYYKAFRQKEKDQSFVSKLWSLFGWDGWTRTNEWRSQSPLPYRLATPQYYNRIIIYKYRSIVKRKNCKLMVYKKSNPKELDFSVYCRYLSAKKYHRYICDFASAIASDFKNNLILEVNLFTCSNCILGSYCSVSFGYTDILLFT